MKKLGMTIELDPKGDKITCPAFGLHSSPAEYSTMVHIVLDLTSLAYPPKSRERSAHQKRHVTFALSEQKSSYPAHARENLMKMMTIKPLVRPDRSFVSEDEDDEPLVQPSSRKEPAKEKREAAAERSIPAPLRRRKGFPVWRDPPAPLEQDVSGNSRERSEEVSILCRVPDGEALRNIIHKLSDERNLRELHLKHYHMSTAPFKKRTTYLNIPGKVYDLYQHVVKTCPFCISTKPRPDRSRVSGIRAEEFGDPIFLDHGSTKNGDKTFGFLIILDGATSHLTTYPCKSISPSEVISKLHDWMDTFQMNPKAICADMAFHHPHDMQVFYRMHNVKRLPTGPHTPWPNRAEMGVRLFKKFLSVLVDTASENLDETTLSQITPAQLMRKSATVRNTQVTVSGKTLELAMVRRPRDLMDPASMNPEQLISTPTKQDLLFKKLKSWLWRRISKYNNDKTLVEILLNGWSLFLPISEYEKVCFIGKKIRAKFSKDGSLEDGWMLRFLLLNVPWWLSVLINPFIK